MLSLQNILSTGGQEFFDNLLNKEVVVTEKLNASTLSFQKKHTSENDLNRNLTFYKGSGLNKKEITIADRVMTTFYSSGMTYLNNLSKLIIDRIPANWTFVCKYFPNHQPSFINYSILPKNNLVLSCIVTSSGTILEDVEDLRTWAEMFDIAVQEPVYRGYLTQYQKERLTEYIKDNSNNKESFSRFVITMLNPTLTHSLYQDDGFESPIDGFVFKFISDDGVSKPVSAKLIDPYMLELISKNKSKKSYTDNTDVLLSDFAVFMSGQDMDSIVLTGKNEDERYLELFYRLFNRYIKYKKSQLEDFDVDTNDVVKESIDVDFSVDIDQISNETTKKLLIENPEYKPIFKTLLGSFKSKKSDDYKSVVMSPGVVRIFNNVVDDIHNKCLSGEESDNLSFGSYLDSIKKKDINTFDINNAPEEVRKNSGFDIQEPEVEDHLGSALSFADFKKEDKKKEESAKESNTLKSIEDIIKDLQGKVQDITDELKKNESDKKEEGDDNSKGDKDKESKDDKKEDTKHDGKKAKGDGKDSKEDQDRNGKDRKESEKGDGKDSKVDDDNAEDDDNDPLKGI